MYMHLKFAGCGNRFLEEGLFVLGYFWHEDKVQLRVGKDWPPIFLSYVLDYFKEVVGSLHQLARLHCAYLTADVLKNEGSTVCLSV